MKKKYISSLLRPFLVLVLLAAIVLSAVYWRNGRNQQTQSSDSNNGSSAGTLAIDNNLAGGISLGPSSTTSSEQKPTQQTTNHSQTQNTQTKISKPTSQPTSTDNSDACASWGNTCAWFCFQSNQSYDQLSQQTRDSTETVIQYDKAQAQLSFMSQNDLNKELNQAYAIANTSLQGEYSGYLKEISAIPNCTANFDPPVLYPLIPLS